MNVKNRKYSVPIIGICRHRLQTDGEGVSTLVAFHGCPLRCRYCLNPQSLENEDDWEAYDCQSLYEKVKVDALYFLATKGGITFGGGEPCLRSEFIRDFRQLCGKDWLLTVETSLNVPEYHIEHLLPVTDRFIIDIKDMNPEIYRRYTERENDNVLRNLRLLLEHGRGEDIIIRIPLIPGYNTEEDRERSVEQLKSWGLSHFDLFDYTTSKTLEP